MVIYGREIREQLKQSITDAAKQMPVSMAIIQAGEDMSSASYIKGIQRFAAETGIKTEVINLAPDASEQQIINTIKELNRDDRVTGIMVQTPLPAGCNVSKVINSMEPDKDVEGIHNYNLGRLISGEKGVRPCTPAAVLEILKAHNVPLEGARVTIVGRSMVVGSPLSVMMTAENATVTLCHSRTRNLARETLKAEIVVAAVGKAGFITPDMVNEDAVIIDVGTNFTTDGKMVGDVHEDCMTKARIVSAVPGGVGVITVAELFMNLITLGKKRFGHN
jgi:methylenetetrahydrofolate dehydrogenase (NADP+)/methenyltetrahydrofolate cyclohydrolase